MKLHKYGKVFAACTDDYLGEGATSELLDILRHFDEDEIHDTLFNSTRKIVEDLFKALNKHKLLPDTFVNTSVSLTSASKFLSGKEEFGYTLREESRLPSSICDELYFVLHIVQSGSHSSDLKQRLNSQQTPYLTVATVNTLLDILVWFKDYIDSEPVKKNWTNSNANSSKWLPGTVKILNGMYSFNDSAGGINIPSKFTDGLKDGDQVEVRRASRNDRGIIEIRKI